MISFINILAAEGGVHHDNGVHLAGDIKEVYWGSAAFFVLLALFMWKGLPKVKAAMRARTESIRSELAEAAAERSEAEANLEESSQAMPDLGKERSRIRREAIESSEKLKVDLVRGATQDAEAIVAKGRLDCENMKRQASADLSAQVAELTRETTEAVVINDINNQTQIDLIDSYIDRVGQLV